MDARSLQKLEKRLKLLEIPPFKFFLMSRNRQKDLLRMVPNTPIFKYCTRHKRFITHDHQYMGPRPKRQSDPIQAMGNATTSINMQVKKLASAQMKRLRRAKRNKVNWDLQTIGKLYGGSRIV